MDGTILSQEEYVLSSKDLQLVVGSGSLVSVVWVVLVVVLVAAVIRSLEELDPGLIVVVWVALALLVVVYLLEKPDPVLVVVVWIVLVVVVGVVAAVVRFLEELNPVLVDDGAVEGLFLEVLDGSPADCSKLAGGLELVEVAGDVFFGGLLVLVLFRQDRVVVVAVGVTSHPVIKLAFVMQVVDFGWPEIGVHDTKLLVTTVVVQSEDVEDGDGFEDTGEVEGAEGDKDAGDD